MKRDNEASRIVGAKDNYVAYMHHEPCCAKIDEPKKVTLSDIFDFPQPFTQAEITLYGEIQTVRYYCEDFLRTRPNVIARGIIARVVALLRRPRGNRL
jgi:hypothetical protein